MGLFLPLFPYYKYFSFLELPEQPGKAFLFQRAKLVPDNLCVWVVSVNRPSPRYGLSD
jgi:hypothetical protein